MDEIIFMIHKPGSHMCLFSRSLDNHTQLSMSVDSLLEKLERNKTFCRRTRLINIFLKQLVTDFRNLEFLYRVL
jgi:hypothetical protein